MNVSLTAEDFTALVRGEIVEKRDRTTNASVRIALQDIGWDRMQGIVAQVKQEARHGRRAQAEERAEGASSARP